MFSKHPCVVCSPQWRSLNKGLVLRKEACFKQSSIWSQQRARHDMAIRKTGDTNSQAVSTAVNDLRKGPGSIIIYNLFAKNICSKKQQ